MAPEAEGAKSPETRKGSASKRAIKFLGDVDTRIIEKGETWAGRLAAPGLDRELRWDWDNNHLLDVGDLDSEIIDMILEDPEFVDVTGRKTIPVAQVAKRLRPTGEAPPNANLVAEVPKGETRGGAASGINEDHS